MSEKISVLLRTSEYQGDHSDAVSIACELREGETVQQLAERLLKDGSYSNKFHDVIELRLVRP